MTRTVTAGENTNISFSVVLFESTANFARLFNVVLVKCQ